MIIVTPITDGEVAFYQHFFLDHIPVGWLKEESLTRIILRMKPGAKPRTPYHCARDCGDHYIVARYTSFYRIDKDTLAVSRVAEDA